MRRAQRYTTLPHSSSGRRNTTYVRVACTRYAAASCVGACHLSPHHTTRFCCAADRCACPSMRKHRDLCNSSGFDTNPSLYINVHRSSFLTSVFSDLFAKIADYRQQITCGERNATGMWAYRILSLRRRVYFVIPCHVLSSCSLVLITCSLRTSILQ